MVAGGVQVEPGQAMHVTIAESAFVIACEVANNLRSYRKHTYPSLAILPNRATFTACTQEVEPSDS